LAELTVIWWRDIPAQVVAKEGRESSKVVLDERFQDAIDQAATRIGLIGTDEYLAEWHRLSRICDPDLAAAAAAEASALEAAYPIERLAGLIRTGGLENG